MNGNNFAIRQLEDADAATLRQIWTRTKGSAPPRTFTARLMRLALAWDAQVTSEQAEPAKIRRQWARIIRARSARGTANGVRVDDASRTADGTRILKEWGGVKHEVHVTGDGGATWNGRRYSSLSAVARAMTGTNRNGPKFFGLRDRTGR